MKRVTAFVLAVLVVSSFSACAGMNKETIAMVKEKTECMLECQRNNDVDGVLALMYPGAADENLLPQQLEQLNALFPIPEEYTLMLRSYSVHSSANVDGKSRTYVAEFELTSDAVIYEIQLNYTVDSRHEGVSGYSIDMQSGDLFNASNGVSSNL